MNITKTKTLKTLFTVGVASLGLYAGASQADYDGYPAYRGNPYLPQPQMHHYNNQEQMLDRFDARLDNHLDRILQGMEKGKLTLREAIALLQEHQEINRLERRYTRDGRLGPRELADLDRRLDMASDHIQAEKKDRERVGDNRRYDR